MRSHLLTLSLAAALSLGSSGCIKKVMTDGQIQGTRQGSLGLDSVPDYELARAAIAGGIAQFEGMHVLAPDNTDALYLLTKTWVSYAFAFLEDDLQVAQDAGDDDLAEYHRKRARNAYDRAVFYGLQLLSQRARGFDQAKKNEQTLTKWLTDNFTTQDDAVNLLWTGQAWLLRVGLMQGDDNEGAQFVADLWIGVAMLDRAKAIDPTPEHYSVLNTLGAYHARSTLAELDEAKKDFDLALAKTENKSLMIQFTYASTYACVKGDSVLYQALLNKILQAVDPDPEQRLANTIAKRRAKRWLGKRRVKDKCGFDVAGPGAVAGK
jgi:tetratricopeptide (TPR) repeat protein